VFGLCVMGDRPHPQTPNPQSPIPIPNPQLNILDFKKYYLFI